MEEARSEPGNGRLTNKGKQARERLLECALRLFERQGYEETTMRAIAAEAGYSPGLTYRYFASKDEIVLVLYQQLARALEDRTRDLPPGTLGERFQIVVTRHFELMGPYRKVFTSLFGAALNPRTKAGLFGESTREVRQLCRSIYLRMIQEASDAPRLAQREDLATVFYGAHLALALFWLIDDSHETIRTTHFLLLLRDVLKLVQPMFWLPPISQSLARLAAIIGPLLGDPRSEREGATRSNEE